MDNGQLTSDNSFLGCGKCSNRHLTKEYEYNKVETCIVLKCPLCGWRKYSQVRTEGQIERPIEEVRRTPITAATQYQKRKLDPIRSLVQRGVVCAVISCGRPLNGKNRSGLCKICITKVNVWEGTKQTSPSPFVPAPDQPGRLILNPLRIRFFPSNNLGDISKRSMPCLNAC